MTSSTRVVGCFFFVFLSIPAFAQPTQTVFSDNFNSYYTSDELAGQGGWYKEPSRTALMLSATTPLGSSVAVDGLRRTGDGTFKDANVAYVWHSLPGGLNPTGISVFSVDAYAFSAYNSHNGGVILSSVDSSVLIQALASWYPSNSPAWEFAGRNGDDYITGGNLSSSNITLHVVSITQALTTWQVSDSGNANPNSDFRFDSLLGNTGGYIFNLKTRGLSTGSTTSTSV